MPDWIKHTFASDIEMSASASAARLAVALLLGIAVAGIYRFTRGARAQRQLLATLVMLSVLLSITTLVIGDNVARAFSIVGALSIVRFRTVVSDTRDTAFVIFAVAVGMAAGAGFFMTPFLSLPFVLTAAWMFDASRGSVDHKGLAFEVKLRIEKKSNAAESVASILHAHSKRCSLRGVSSPKNGAALEHVYAIRLGREPSPLALVELLSAVEGVQSVELKRD